MPKDIHRIIVVFISRSIAKCFLFLALSMSTPAVNAMRSLEEREAIVIVLDYHNRNRNRGLTRAFGYTPARQFVMYV
jgi:hypothetical protein